MAFPTAVNSQITDAVAQASAKTLGSAPAVAMGAVYQTMAQAVAISCQNAVYAQQQANVLAQAATTQGIATLYALDTAGAATRPT